MNQGDKSRFRKKGSSAESLPGVSGQLNQRNGDRNLKRHGKLRLK